MAIQTKPPIRRISIDEVQQRIKQLVFVDARSATALTRNPQQVPGAVHVQAKSVDEGMKRLPRDRTLVTYCTCSDEKTSARVARELKERGFQDVYPLRGGFKAWQNAGLPVEAIPAPK